MAEPLGEGYERAGMVDSLSHFMKNKMRDEHFYKSYRIHGTVGNKIKSFSSRFSFFYDSMSSDCDLYHAPSFKKLKAESFISVLLCLLLFPFGA